MSQALTANGTKQQMLLQEETYHMEILAAPLKNGICISLIYHLQNICLRMVTLNIGSLLQNKLYGTMELTIIRFIKVIIK